MTTDPDRPLVLVVDDDPDTCTLLTTFLEQHGYAARAVTNGADCLAAVGREPVSLVLLDMRMPVLDGWGFIQAIRERGLNLTVVVMTATADARRWAVEIGAQGVLAKPFDLDELIAEVQRLGPSLTDPQPG